MSEQEAPIKEWLTNYVGEKEIPEDSEVTVEMMVKHMAKEFPEFLMVVAEENWDRGYRQALVDIDHGRQAQNNEKLPTV